MAIDLRSKVENSFNKNYKKFILVPLVILILSIIIIAIHFAKTGDFINRDISLKCGLSITINTNKDINPISLETQILSKFSNSDAVVRKLSEFKNFDNIWVSKEIGLMSFFVFIVIDNPPFNEISLFMKSPVFAKCMAIIIILKIRITNGTKINF